MRSGVDRNLHRHALSMTPLDGLTVLDFSRVLAGPYCTMQLADLGARVIKIEQPGRGDDTRAWGPPFVGGESAYFLSVNRNKESLALDLKHPRARRDRSTRCSHARTSSSRTSGRGRWSGSGLATTTVAARHPRLVYCSISGFGQTGPRRAEAGYDAMMQAEGGLMSITGAAGGPPFRARRRDRATSRPGCSPCRASSRRCFARATDRRAASASTSRCSTRSRRCSPTRRRARSRPAARPARLGNRHPSIAPYDTFAAADGDFVLSVGNDDQFRRLSRRAATRPALARRSALRDQRGSRARTTRRLRGDLSPLLARADAPICWQALKAAGVPSGAVRTSPRRSPIRSSRRAR